MSKDTRQFSIGEKRDQNAKEIRKKYRLDFITQKRSKLMSEHQSGQGLVEADIPTLEEQKNNILNGLKIIEEILSIFNSQKNQTTINIFRALLLQKKDQFEYKILGTETIYKINFPDFIKQLQSIAKIDSDIIKQVNLYNSFEKPEIYLGNYEAISQRIFKSLSKCVDVFQFCRNIIKQLSLVSNFVLQGNPLKLIDKITDVLIEQTYVQLQEPKKSTIDYTKIGQVKAFKQSKLGQMIFQFTAKVKQLSKDISNQIFSVFKVSVNLIISNTFTIQSLQKVDEYATAMDYLENLVYVCGNLLSDIKSKKQSHNTQQMLEVPRSNNLTPNDVIQFLKSFEDLISYQNVLLSSRKLFLSTIIQKRFRQIINFCQLQAWASRIIALSGWIDNQSENGFIISNIMKRSIENSITKIVIFISQNKQDLDPTCAKQFQQKVLTVIQQLLVLYLLLQQQESKAMSSLTSTYLSNNQQANNSQSFSIILIKILHFLKQYTKVKRQKKIVLLIEKIYTHLIQICQVYFRFQDLAQTQSSNNGYQVVTSQISISILEFILDCANGDILCSQCLSLAILLFQHNKNKKGNNMHTNSDLLDFIYVSFIQNLNLFNPSFQNQQKKKIQVQSSNAAIGLSIQDMKGQKISKYQTNIVKLLIQCYDYYNCLKVRRSMVKLVQQGLKGKQMRDQKFNQNKSLFQQLLTFNINGQSTQQLKNFVTIQFLFNYFKYIAQQFNQNNMQFIMEALKFLKFIIVSEQSLQEQIKDMFQNNSQDIKSIVDELTTSQNFDVSMLAVQILESLALQY